MKIKSFHRFLSIVMLLALLLPLSPSSSLLARQGPLLSIAERPMDPTADTSAPATVANLVASTGAASGTVELSWVAPGDDATAGTASTYIVRYNTTTITEDNWDTSTDVTGEPVPSPAGSFEGMIVSGLTPGQQYYFAIRAQDKVPNISEISNNSRATAQIGPNVTYLPIVLSSVSDVPPVIPETTEVMPPETTQYLSDISGDGTVFTFTQSTADLAALVPGNVIVGDVSTAAPYGFLRKVTSVSEQNGQIIVTTQEATLEDAIEQGSASFSQRLTPADIESMTALPGVAFADLSTTSLQDSFFFQLKDVVLWDKDGNHNTTNDQLRANGSFKLAPDVLFSFVIRNRTLEELDIGFEIEEEVELEFGYEVELASIEGAVQIATVRLGTITAFVGLVPVVIVIEMPIYVRFEGDLNAGITTKVIQRASLSMGARYQEGDWSPFGNLSNTFEFEPPRPSVDVAFKGYLDPPLHLKLYGVAGPYAGVQPYLKVESELLPTQWVKLYGGLDAVVGVKIEVLGRSLGNYTKTVLGYKLLLAQIGDNTSPKLPFSPSPADDTIVQNLDTDLSWSGGDLDGDDVIYRVYFEADDSTPDFPVYFNMPDTIYDPGTLAPNTRYYWRVVAQDEHGATTAGPVWSFTTATGATCPIDLTLQSPQTSDLTVTINGTVSSSCSTITHLNWQWGNGVSDNQWFPARHTYAVSGTYPITATAYNNLGDTKVAYTTVHMSTATDNLDPAFGSGGKVATPIGGRDDGGQALAIQSDGKIVVAGWTDNGTDSDFAVVRYNTDGSLDTAFGSGGKVTTDFGYNDIGEGIALQSDGKIVVVGYSEGHTIGTPYYGVWAIARYNTDGSLDTTFDGDGKVTTDIGASIDSAYTVAIQSDGKIVVGGQEDNKVPGDFAVVRYNSDGSLDTTFGVNGIVDTPIGTGYDVGYGDIMLQSDGKIILTGYAQMSSSNHHFAAVRYNSDGSLDTSFGNDGKVTTDLGGQYDYAVGSALQPDGKIVLAGFTGYTIPKDYDIAIVRYNTDGSLDTTFDSNGKIIVNLGSTNEGIQGIVCQPDGKIVLAGYSGGDFVVLRYNSDGSLDTTFSSSGYVTTDFGNGDDAGGAVAIQTDGKIVVAGRAHNGTDHDFAVARYLTDSAQ